MDLQCAFRVTEHSEIFKGFIDNKTFQIKNFPDFINPDVLRRYKVDFMLGEPIARYAFYECNVMGPILEDPDILLCINYCNTGYMWFTRTERFLRFRSGDGRFMRDAYSDELCKPATLFGLRKTFVKSFCYEYPQAFMAYIMYPDGPYVYNGSSEHPLLKVEFDVGKTLDPPTWDLYDEMNRRDDVYGIVSYEGKDVLVLQQGNSLVLDL